MGSFDWIFKRKFVISAVNVETGDYHTWNEKDPHQATKAALSSSAIPFVFPNQADASGNIYMDGGTVWNTNIISAIERCRE